MADQAQQTPEARLYAAGFTRRLEWWVPPASDRALTLDDAVAALDAGEVEPGGALLAVTDQPGLRELTPEAVDALADRCFRPPPPPPPPWLEPVAELVAGKLKPIIRAEIRAALKAEAAERAREPKP